MTFDEWWPTVHPTDSDSDRYWAKMAWCAGRVLDLPEISDEMIERESESEPENNGFISGAKWARDEMSK